MQSKKYLPDQLSKQGLVSKKNSPRVSIGLAVYNGENFIREAIDSILAQTFTDFELIISDNASTDQTEAICKAYAAQDERVRYYRNPENFGAVVNSNRAFELASGEYFKWASHDDVIRPEFLAKCVEVLDRDPSVILCYPRTITIDEQGNPRKEWETRPEFDSTVPYRRFREVLAPVETFPIWGLMRSEVLKKTPLFGSYPECDLTLLTELSLHGRFYEIPEFLFLSREHRKRSVRAYDFRNPYKAIAWYNPKRSAKLFFPAWQLLAGHIAGINRSPVSWRDRLPCYLEMAKWIKEYRHQLLRDIIVATKQVPGIGSAVTQVHKQQVESSWSRQVAQIVKAVESIIPVEEAFILVDENQFDSEAFSRWRTLPFLEQNGQYWGLPPDDYTAIAELERLHQNGANFIVFTWPTFWWFSHYTNFHGYLRSKFCCLLENDHLVVFKLRQ
ncbi:MAG: glycosyltransferase family 2 protein [Moorea sp. SIO4E2]|uniref:glycosyltransferase family 2 protein n=1 Tax=Moorena sp. SIO4E2 TaxID=2607826 RepID=UPI0013B9B2C3|nr:glycosyltransferase family 2 protein [Moorena sp. SIO4E2]NEQ05155.1 glycosyltransferase family 2 protein [Moorena sp. SIO4E2]